MLTCLKMEWINLKAIKLNLHLIFAIKLLVEKLCENIDADKVVYLHEQNLFFHA